MNCIHLVILYIDCRYLELSFFGIVIGHEVAHSVDINSRKHMDEDELSLFNSSFNKVYKSKAQCFADKYSSYLVNETSQYVSKVTGLERNY